MKNLFLILTITVAVFTRPALAQEDKWEEYKGQHFIIYYKDAPEDFIKSIESMAEHYYEEITQNLGFTRYKSWSWDERAKIFIYRDADDYVNNARMAKWSHGASSAKDKVIRTFPSAHGFFDSTLPHELGHIIFREFVGYKSQLPLWLDEGVAMYQEKARRWGSTKDVQEALANGTFLSLQQLTDLQLSNNSDQNLVNLFYSEAASIVYFMITQLGEYRFVNFCRELKEGNSMEEALKVAYVRFSNLDALNKAWVDYLKQ